MSRSAVWRLLTTDPVIQSLGFNKATNMYGNNAIDREKRGGPFLVLAWDAVTPGVGPVWRDQKVTLMEVRIWVHVNKYDSNDYASINKVLERVKELMVETLHYQGTDGTYMSHADWTGDSADLTDDILNTLTRNSAFRVVSRKG